MSKRYTEKDVVLFLRTCHMDGYAYGGYCWDLRVGAVNVPDRWNPQSECGNGLHGLEWGNGDQLMLSIANPPRIFVVFGALRDETVRIKRHWSIKAKVKRAVVLYVGDERSARRFIAKHRKEIEGKK